MTFSYNPALPSDLDKVRFYVGDRTTPGHLLENEEILATLTIQPSPKLAAAAICDTLAASFARKVDKSIGLTRLSSSQAFDHYRRLAEALREGGSSADGTGALSVDAMAVGGISRATRDDLRGGDSDRIQPSFQIGQDDSPEVVTAFDMEKD